MDELLVKVELPHGVLDEGMGHGVECLLEIHEHGKAWDVVLDGIVHGALPDVSAWKVGLLVVANDFFAALASFCW